MRDAADLVDKLSRCRLEHLSDAERDALIHCISAGEPWKADTAQRFADEHDPEDDQTVDLSTVLSFITIGGLVALSPLLVMSMTMGLYTVKSILGVDFFSGASFLHDFLQ